MSSPKASIQRLNTFMASGETQKFRLLPGCNTPFLYQQPVAAVLSVAARRRTGWLRRPHHQWFYQPTRPLPVGSLPVCCRRIQGKKPTAASCWPMQCSRPAPPAFQLHTWQTDHDGYYEKYGWQRIEDGIDLFTGQASRIYKMNLNCFNRKNENIKKSEE